MLAVYHRPRRFHVANPSKVTMITSSHRGKGSVEMVTVQEAAKRLKVSRSRVQQFIDEGRLPAQKLTARMYVVDAADLKEFAKIQRKPGRKPAKTA